jgi:hypothetical protein
MTFILLAFGSDSQLYQDSDCDSDFDRVEHMLESLHLGRCVSDGQSDSDGSDSVDTILSSHSNPCDSEDSAVIGTDAVLDELALPDESHQHSVAFNLPGEAGNIHNAESANVTENSPDTQAQAGRSDDESTKFNWQTYIDDLLKPQWPNHNWNLLSRLLNILGCSDRDADVVLDTIRQLDWTVSIPKHVAELRKVETLSLGSKK